MLVQSGCGLGMFGLASLFGEAQAATEFENPLAPKPPHFPAKAKHIIHIFLNGGPSHVDTFDPKPILAKYAGKPLPNENLRTERKTGAAFPSPFKFKKYGHSGIDISEIFSHSRPACRRFVRHPLDARGRSQSRTVADADELRRSHAAAAQRRLVDHLRTGDRKPEPARVRRLVPARLSDQGHGELAVGLSAGQLPGDLRRHAVQPGRQTDRQHPQPDHHLEGAAPPIGSRPGNEPPPRRTPPE